MRECVRKIVNSATNYSTPNYMHIIPLRHFRFWMGHVWQVSLMSPRLSYLFDDISCCVAGVKAPVQDTMIYSSQRMVHRPWLTCHHNSCIAIFLVRTSLAPEYTKFLINRTCLENKKKQQQQHAIEWALKRFTFYINNHQLYSILHWSKASINLLSMYFPIDSVFTHDNLFIQIAQKF